MKKIIALSFAAALLMTLFYGCKGGGDGKETTDEGVTDECGFYIDDSKIPLEIGDTVD